MPLFSDPTLFNLTGAGAPSATGDEEEVSSGDEEEEEEDSEAEDELAGEVGLPGLRSHLPSAPLVTAADVGNVAVTPAKH